MDTLMMNSGILSPLCDHMRSDNRYITEYCLCDLLGKPDAQLPLRRSMFLSMCCICISIIRNSSSIRYWNQSGRRRWRSWMTVCPFRI